MVNLKILRSSSEFEGEGEVFRWSNLWRKFSRSNGENQKQTQPTFSVTSRIRTRLVWSAFSTAPTLQIKSMCSICQMWWSGVIKRGKVFKCELTTLTGHLMPDLFEGHHIRRVLSNSAVSDEQYETKTSKTLVCWADLIQCLVIGENIWLFFWIWIFFWTSNTFIYAMSKQSGL